MSLKGSGSSYVSIVQTCWLLVSSVWMMQNAMAFSAVPQKAAAAAIRRQSSSRLHSISASGMWTNGNNFGKGQFKFYTSFDGWMKPFGEEDREAYPEMFQLPKGVYEVSLQKPLGIIFEEVEAGNNGVVVVDLVEGGNADKMGGTIQKGDILIALTAIKVSGAKWERRMIPATQFDFDTVVGAIGSNDEKWGCSDVVLQFQRPGEFDPDQVASHLKFFNPPPDSPWRR